MHNNKSRSCNSATLLNNSTWFYRWLKKLEWDNENHKKNHEANGLRWKNEKWQEAHQIHMSAYAYVEFHPLIQYIFLQGFFILLFLLWFFYYEIPESGYGILICRLKSYVCKKTKRLSLIFPISLFRIEQHLISILDSEFTHF